MSDSDSSSLASSSENDESVEQSAQKRARITKSETKPIELVPAVISKEHQRSSLHRSRQKIIVLLDQARLETVKNRRGLFELLNCDDHRDLCKKKLKRDPKEFRPDICHQELLTLIDSPLNKSGALQIYVRTSNNVLFEIHPSTRLPRTYKRFSGLMVQLLHKMKIKGSTSSSATTLMKVIKNPFSQHLPAGTHVYGMSCEGKLYSPRNLANALLPPVSSSDSKNHPPVCFVIGAMASGHITKEEHPYIEEMISVSEYPLSGAAAIARILCGIEQHWGIV